jgi:predicted dehydrogenase
MTDRVGIGIIGTGFARRVQIPGFRTCEGAEIVSVASGSIENARAAAEEFGIEHYTDDWQETVSRDDVDLICITTPPKLHREMTLFAVEKGKHVLCEKPMAMNVAEAEEMTSAARIAGVMALIDHELRFQPGRRRAYQMLREGVIGKVRHAKYNFRALYRGNPDLPWNWWSNASQGGGALGAINSHVIDSLNWFLGTEVSTAYCQLATRIKQRRDPAGNMRDVTSDDEANMLLTFADSEVVEDATGLVSVSMAEGPTPLNRVEFFGTDGSMRVDQFGELYVAKNGDRDWQSVDVDLGKPLEGVGDSGFPRGFLKLAPEIIKALQAGKTEIDNAATFEDGVKVQRVLDAARESHAKGKLVSVQGASFSSSQG